MSSWQQECIFPSVDIVSLIDEALGFSVVSWVAIDFNAKKLVEECCMVDDTDEILAPLVQDWRIGVVCMYICWVYLNADVKAFPILVVALSLVDTGEIIVEVYIVVDIFSVGFGTPLSINVDSVDDISNWFVELEVGWCLDIGFIFWRDDVGYKLSPDLKTDDFTVLDSGSIVKDDMLSPLIRLSLMGLSIVIFERILTDGVEKFCDKKPASLLLFNVEVVV